MMSARPAPGILGSTRSCTSVRLHMSKAAHE